MAYGKDKMGGGTSMNSLTGMCSSKSNPLPAPSMTSRDLGAKSNPDAQKVNKMLKEAYVEKDSTRGTSGT